ncbi:hypothetical protein [Staphylococcus cornubiensis]|uniref:hypothetical protein n=1 Tax=Staphylococcus cornubiensis TaxID=1986155 RepID=UPI00135669F2|nr:hypothetical protein [Staphylococcus cornubiensis]
MKIKALTDEIAKQGEHALTLTKKVVFVIDKNDQSFDLDVWVCVKKGSNERL